jgi:cytochrome P450
MNHRTFKSGMANLIMAFPSTRTAREAIQVMNLRAAAFQSCYRKNNHQKGLAIVQARYKHSMDHHIPLNDIARSEFANGVALLSNTVPNTFWMMYHVYSDPSVLAECRKELSDVAVATDGNQGEHTCSFDMPKVKTLRPILLSTYKEMLHVYSTAVSARLVMEDDVLNNQYLFKKGSTVMMPTSVQHRNPDNALFDH